MSPEHARGSVTIDARANLYSLGCVLYELLAGEPPFTGTAPNKVWMKALTDAPVPIAVHRDALPSDVGVTLDRLLAKTPEARFPDAAQLVASLSMIQSLRDTWGPAIFVRGSSRREANSRRSLREVYSARSVADGTETNSRDSLYRPLPECLGRGFRFLGSARSSSLLCRYGHQVPRRGPFVPQSDPRESALFA